MSSSRSVHSARLSPAHRTTFRAASKVVLGDSRRSARRCSGIWGISRGDAHILYPRAKPEFVKLQHSYNRKGCRGISGSALGAVLAFVDTCFEPVGVRNVRTHPRSSFKANAQVVGQQNLYLKMKSFKPLVLWQPRFVTILANSWKMTWKLN
jgi:hypothetical protein